MNAMQFTCQRRCTFAPPGAEQPCARVASPGRRFEATRQCGESAFDHWARRSPLLPDLPQPDRRAHHGAL